MKIVLYFLFYKLIANNKITVSFKRMAKVLVHVEKNILEKVKNELSTNKDVANNDKNIITEHLFKNDKDKTIKNQ